MPRSVCPTKCQLFCPHMDTGGPTAVEDDEDLNAHQVECPAQDSWCEMFVKQWTLPPMNENRWKKNMAEELSGWRSRERGVGERRRGQGITRMNTSLRAPIHPVLPSSHKKKIKTFKQILDFHYGADWAKQRSRMGDIYVQYMQGSTPADLCINLVWEDGKTSGWEQ